LVFSHFIQTRMATMKNLIGIAAVRVGSRQVYEKMWFCIQNKNTIICREVFKLAFLSNAESNQETER